MSKFGGVSIDQKLLLGASSFEQAKHIANKTADDGQFIKDPLEIGEGGNPAEEEFVKAFAEEVQEQ
eukprot:CAMPEP_0170494374 /NCGR_PEP_ID=MMETSP0208-20121228/14605_1 /TAXON_ID=197538 /ORGANISM="Strombidium inclinatum, Strain S3" /LENGTH=65 /DNA_ID=CAMNT_0010770425 /DNA_START=2965 /DNA_END=3165 /DNA_ORIENTATION=-